MKKTLSFLFILGFFLAINCNVIGQTKDSTIILYKTSSDFIENRKADFKANVIIKDEGENYIQIKQVVNPYNNEKIAKWRSYWAVEYSGSKYFNLGYSGDLNQWGVYAKFDIIGKYCAIFLDHNSRKIVKNGGNSYGGGLMGVLLNNSNKWGKNWVDENGNKKKILFIDTSKIEPRMLSRNESSIGDLLTKEKFIEAMGNNYHNIDLNEISFEKIVEIIREINANETR